MDTLKHFMKRGGELPSAITDCSELPFFENYSIPLQIAAIFCILLFSFIGVFLPIIVKKCYEKVSWAGTLLNYGRAFGAGTILATAFIHMIVPGFVNLTNPCVPEAFLEYVAFAPALTLVAILGMNLLHFLFISYHHNDCCEDAETLPTSSPKQESPIPVSASLSSTTHAPAGYSPSGSLALLFSGIAFHSVIIGITLGVSSGSEFVALWIALSFHQFFEGVALGTSIVSKLNASKKLLSWFYILGYSLSTPLGAAIGVGIHESYNPNSAEALVAVGIIDSICAGILIYTGLTEFIGPEITDNEKFRVKSRKEKVATFGCLYAGAGLMALLGYWA